MNSIDPVYSIRRNNRNFSMSFCILIVAKLVFCFYMSCFFSVISEVFRSVCVDLVCYFSDAELH